MIGSPAAPHFTPEELQRIADVFMLYPREDNRSIRDKIAAYQDARRMWDDAGKLYPKQGQ